jgi:ADP-heptose:LPS heptosyltransferase
MTWTGPFDHLVALILRRYEGHLSERDPARPRILVIRRNRLGDMICTVPLLRALRRHYSEAHLTVACDEAGAPVARAVRAVDEVVVLEAAGFQGLRLWTNARRLQEYDWVIGVKGGFDRRLARLVRLTGGARRIGFGDGRDEGWDYYTDPVALPSGIEHQVETVLRLLQPLGITEPSPEIRLDLPAEGEAFADGVLSESRWKPGRFVVINISSTVRLRFGPEDFLEVTRRVLEGSELAVIFVGAPVDQGRAGELAERAGSERVGAMATPGPLELAAVMKRARVGTAAVVLWSEGPFEKGRSRGENHVFVRAAKGGMGLSVEEVWGALRPFLARA